MNKPLSQAYYLKEQLREVWTQGNRDEAENILLDWVKQAQESKVPQLMKMAATIMAHRTGILHGITAIYRPEKSKVSTTR